MAPTIQCHYHYTTKSMLQKLNSNYVLKRSLQSLSFALALTLWLRGASRAPFVASVLGSIPMYQLFSLKFFEVELQDECP